MAFAEHLAARGAEASPADGEGKRPLHWAAGYGHVTVAEHLATRRAEAASPADDSAQPLHHAVDHGHVAVAQRLTLVVVERSQPPAMNEARRREVMVSRTPGHLTCLSCP